MIQYPRILIFGQPFDNVTGGGITLSNLFAGWPKDKIAVAATGHFLYYVTHDVCDTYYQLGEKEQKWMFPFNLFQRVFPSGIKKFDVNISIVNSKHKRSLRHLFVNNVFYPVLTWLGLYHFASKMSLSTEFKTWLDEFSPDILYIQVSNRENIHFASELIDYLKKPVVIHMMDDWPETISSGPFKKYWKHKIDKEFKILLNKIDLHLSISDAMSDAYQKRYQKKFIGFHNPVDISKFGLTSNNILHDKNIFKILYVGRIGNANINSINTFAGALASIKNGSRNIVFDLYTPDADSLEIRKIKDRIGTNVYRPVAHEKIPGLISEYDLLLLPLDFTKTGLKYARYSIPTKASEFMVSGVPIVVFAPQETAVSKLIKNNNCGYCISKNEKGEIVKAIDFLIQNESYRKEIGENAKTLAREKFGSVKVRGEFQNLLITLQKSQNYVR